MTPIASVNLPEIPADSEPGKGTTINLPAASNFGRIRKPVDFVDGPGDPDSGMHLIGDVFETGLVLVGLATANGQPQAMISNPTGAPVSGCVLDLY